MNFPRRRGGSHVTNHPPHVTRGERRSAALPNLRRGGGFFGHDPPTSLFTDKTSRKPSSHGHSETRTARPRATTSKGAPPAPPANDPHAGHDVPTAALQQGPSHRREEQHGPRRQGHLRRRRAGEDASSKGEPRTSAPETRRPPGATTPSRTPQGDANKARGTSGDSSS